MCISRECLRLRDPKSDYASNVRSVDQCIDEAHGPCISEYSDLYKYSTVNNSFYIVTSVVDIGGCFCTTIRKEQK
jgi:hypothetical protein